MGTCCEAFGKHCIVYCLFIHATYCVIVAGASPGETKMWAVVRENGDFITVVNYTIFAAIVDSFMSN